MTAATMGTLVLLTLAATASMARAIGEGAGVGARTSAWVALYVVAVVVPWAWALSRARARAADADCAAPVVTGCTALVAATRLIRVDVDGWLAPGAAIVTVLVVAIFLLLGRRWRPAARPGRAADDGAP